VTVGLVWAQAANGVIGANGALPWHLPEDLARFKALTMGSTVVMGRATWDSLPASVRPLPGRHNVVLTRQPGWTAPGAEVAGSLAAAVDRPGEVWVIGGATVYAAALPLADVLVVTELHVVVDGDTRAPAIGAEWQVVDRDPAAGWLPSRSGPEHRVLTYRRSSPVA
jgi:dihydrofolate reductase